MNIIEYEVTESGKSGSSLQGYVTTTYDKLIGLLGKHTYMSADPYDKVNCEWCLTIKVENEDDPEDWDYEYASIYNWKDGRVFRGILWMWWFHMEYRGLVKKIPR